MAEVVVEIFVRIAAELVGGVISAAIQDSAKSRNGNKSKRTKTNKDADVNVTDLNRSSQPRAILKVSSHIEFGNTCERLVNIAFQTSQMFPKTMRTYGDLVKYMKDELSKLHSDELFHVIIGRNLQFGFSIDDASFFAEIEQQRYQVIIFNTKRSSSTKSFDSDVNSQTVLDWD